MVSHLCSSVNMSQTSEKQELKKGTLQWHKGRIPQIGSSMAQGFFKIVFTGTQCQWVWTHTLVIQLKWNFKQQFVPDCFIFVKLWVAAENPTIKNFPLWHIWNWLLPNLKQQVVGVLLVWSSWDHSWWPLRTSWIVLPYFIQLILKTHLIMWNS